MIRINFYKYILRCICVNYQWSISFYVPTSISFYVPTSISFYVPTSYFNYISKSRFKCVKTFINGLVRNFIPLFNNGFFQKIEISYPTASPYIFLVKHGLFVGHCSSNRSSILPFNISRVNLDVWDLAQSYMNKYSLFC